MRLILVRHGETFANKNRINQSISGGSLNKTGKSQSKKVGLRLKKEKIDHIYVSNLKRAVQTAKEIIKHHPEAEVIYTPQLRERDMGVYEGTPYGTMIKDAEKIGLTWDTFRPKKGESITEVTKRAARFLDVITKKHKGKTVLIVSHGLTIRAILKSLLKYEEKNWRRYKHENTAVTIIMVNKGKKHRLIKLACTKHLGKSKKR